MAKCALCNTEVLDGETYSGIRIGEKNYEGHHKCVVKAIGPEQELKAIKNGHLAAIKEDE